MKKIILFTTLFVCNVLVSQVEVNVHEDALTGKKSMSTEFWKGFGKTKYGTKLSGKIDFSGRFYFLNIHG